MIFFDTGFLYAYINAGDSNHPSTLEIMKNSFAGEYGRMIISNYIIDEAITLGLSRTGDCTLATKFLNFLHEKNVRKNIFLEIIIDKDLMQHTEKLFAIYCHKRLSYTDCSTLAVMENYKIDFLATFAHEFKGIVSILPG